MNKILEQKYPYLSNFFDTVFDSKNKNVANSIIFYGMDVLAQYYFSLSLAKMLNCAGDGTDFCSCVNCSWIKDNQHPAVMTVSKIDNKTDSSKSVISKEQVDNVRNLLVNTSDYHRVFIFCDADFKVLTMQEQERIDSFSGLGLKIPQCDIEGQSWFPKGITKACFQDVAANSLLKSIEEPPEKVTFIFLTEDKDDLISTIVSRSQSFYIPSFIKEIYDTSFLTAWFKDYPHFELNTALKFAKALANYQSENAFTADKVIDSIQFYLKELTKANLSNKFLINKIYKDINKLQESKKMLSSYVKEQSVYEDLAFYFAK